MANHELDSDVFTRDALDPEYARQFAKEWLHQLPNGTIEEFPSDDAACMRQRDYRISVGLDPMTGEPRDLEVVTVAMSRAGY